jgi:hypothetical protein
MKIASLAGVLVVLQAAIAPALAADDLSIECLATCQDSWLDWKKSNSVQLKQVGEHLRSDFSQKESVPYLVPRANMTVAGLRVAQVFPDSLGMGVGFSVGVDATFDQARRSLEKTLGKPLTKCEVGDNMRTCALEIAEKRTLMVMAEDNAKNGTTLLGCYYYYEK